MAYTIVIPARFAATRLPGKPLRQIAGKSLLQHVFECATKTRASQIIVATDDARIRDVATGFGAEVCMTAHTHQSGTQRINEVIQARRIPDQEIIVNLQGDEPLMPAACVEQVTALLAQHNEAHVATLATSITSDDDVFNSNVVKVVLDKHGQALYFSRASIPWQRGSYEQQRIDRSADWSCLRHIGLYAYRAAYIKEYVALPPSPLEQLESLEQLRVLWHGGKIVVGQAVQVPGPGVDTEQDLERVSKLMLT